MRELLPTCHSCGRSMEPRRADRGARGQGDGPEGARRYCSAACRRHKVGPVDRALEASILELLGGRPSDASICPSEAARQVFGEEGDGWRTLMEPARRAARRLVAAGAAEITQKNRVVDPSAAKGPIRIRRSRRPSHD